MLGSLNRGCSVWNTAPVSTASLTVRPHRLESRMREIRPSGSEGGVGSIPHSYLYKRSAPSLPITRFYLSTLSTQP